MFMGRDGGRTVAYRRIVRGVPPADVLRDVLLVHQRVDRAREAELRARSLRRRHEHAAQSRPAPSFPDGNGLDDDRIDRAAPTSLKHVRNREEKSCQLTCALRQQDQLGLHDRQQARFCSRNSASSIGV